MKSECPVWSSDIRTNSFQEQTGHSAIVLILKVSLIRVTVKYTQKIFQYIRLGCIDCTFRILFVLGYFNVVHFAGVWLTCLKWATDENSQLQNSWLGSKIFIDVKKFKLNTANIQFLNSKTRYFRPPLLKTGSRWACDFTATDWIVTSYLPEMWFSPASRWFSWIIADSFAESIFSNYDVSTTWCWRQLLQWFLPILLQQNLAEVCI